MSVRTGILVLLSAIVATFLVAVLVIRGIEQKKFERIAEKQNRAWRRSIDDYLDHHAESVEKLVGHYSLLEGIVPAIADGKRDWAEQRLNENTLNAYSANAIWILKPDLSPFHVTSNLDPSELKGLPLPAGAPASSLGRPVPSHFFAEIAPGSTGGARRFLEFWHTTIHPAWDSKRTTDPEGHLFAARLWDAEGLTEMSHLTGSNFSIASKPATENDPAAGVNVLVRGLDGWDGRPVAWLIAKSVSPFIDELNPRSSLLFPTLVAVTLAIFTVLGVLLMRAVSGPLKLITGSLDTRNLEALRPLQKSHSEFGELARLIDRFFAQRSALVREMSERTAAEKALHESEERLRHAQKMEAIGRLAGGVAHDFNNLLTGIIGYAELLELGLADDPPRRQHAAVIKKAGEQAAGLTRQLLAFSRKQLLEPRVIDLNILLSDMQQLLHRIIGEQIEMVTLRDASVARVRADPSQIEQVILNLAVNARDAMPKGGRITIRTTNLVSDSDADTDAEFPPGSYVAIEVTDVGIGMDRETMSRIFEPFFTTKGPGKGTGLGLATVYGVVKQSGGSVSVRSEVGRGSTFRVYLPIEKAPIDIPETAADAPQSPRQCETILMVEDEDLVRELVCDVLRDEGYNVLSASDGVDALRVAEAHEGHIELLLTDVVMPRMDGGTLAHRLREVRPDIKVLFISGYSEQDISEQSAVDPNAEVLQKPFTPQGLVAKVHEALRNGFATSPQRG